MDAIGNKPFNDSFYLGKGKKLSEINAQGASAQLEAITNVGLRGFRQRPGTDQLEMVSGAYWDGTAYVCTNDEAVMLELTCDDGVGTLNVYSDVGAVIGNPPTWTRVCSFNATGKIFDGGISFTGTGAEDTTANLKIDGVDVSVGGGTTSAPASWKGKNVYLTITGTETINFDLANWSDKDWVNIIIVSNSGGDIITYGGTGGITATNDESKLNHSMGAVTVFMDGTDARIIGRVE